MLLGARTLKADDGRVLLFAWMGMSETDYGRTPQRRPRLGPGAGDTLALDAFAGGAEFCPMGEFVIADARENGV